MGLYDLQFYEYAEYVDRILKKNGYIKVDTFLKSDFIIYLDYGISKPKSKTYLSETPIYGKTGISSISTFGTSNSYINVNHNNINMNTLSDSTSFVNYNYGVIGYKTTKQQYTNYDRYIILWAKNRARFFPSKLRKNSLLWKMTITSTGSSGDLRKVFPIMIAASKDYILKNSKQKLNINISEDDKSVLEVKGIHIKTK